MSKKYYVNVSQKDIENRKFCLTCGDPARVLRISSLLDDFTEISFNREYRIHLDYLKDNPKVVSSMGIGCPSTAIGVEEFKQLGVNTFIRVGISGILSQKVKIGDIKSATGAIRDEGTSTQYIDCVYLTVADVDVVMAFRQAVHNLNLCDRFHEGIIHSKDAFYSEIPEQGPDPLLEGRWEMWKKAGALVTERMEISTIFVICQIRGLRAGGIMAVIGDTNEN